MIRQVGRSFHIAVSIRSIFRSALDHSEQTTTLKDEANAKLSSDVGESGFVPAARMNVFVLKSFPPSSPTRAFIPHPTRTRILAGWVFEFREMG